MEGKSLKSNKGKMKFDVKLMELPVSKWDELEHLNSTSKDGEGKLLICYTPLDYHIEGYLILYVKSLSKKIPKKIIRKLFNNDPHGADFISREEVIGELKIEEGDLNEHIITTLNEWGEVHLLS